MISRKVGEWGAAGCNCDRCEKGEDALGCRETLRESCAVSSAGTYIGAGADLGMCSSEISLSGDCAVLSGEISLGLCTNKSDAFEHGYKNAVAAFQ